MKLKDILTVINSNSNAKYLVGNTILRTRENKTTQYVEKAVNLDKFVEMSYRQLEAMPNVQVLDVGVVCGINDSILRLTLDIDEDSIAHYKS